MTLDEQTKHRLLDAAKQVHQGFIAVDSFKSYCFKYLNRQLTLLEICEEVIENKKAFQTIRLNSQDYDLHLTGDPTLGCQIKLIAHVVPENQIACLIKEVEDYSAEEITQIIMQQSIFLKRDTQSNLHSMIALAPGIVVGGENKKELYRTHLSTLQNIIKKITAGENLNCLLIALATGAGKSYIQALWMLVIYLSGKKGIFAIPNTYISQFLGDIKSVLPQKIIDSITIIHQNHPTGLGQVEGFLKPFITKNNSPLLIVASESLLTEYYAAFNKLSLGEVFLSVDEQHLLMKSERSRLRLIALSKKMLSLFLTATPTQETYEFSGNNPVVKFSNGQKQAAGQGLFPIILEQQARSISERQTFPECQNWFKWPNALCRYMAKKLFMRFCNSIQEEQASAALSIVENLPLFVHIKPNESLARWKYQVPAARKILLIVDENETVINFYRALGEIDNSSNKRQVYRNGNVIDRSDLFHFFEMASLDEEIIAQDRKNKHKKYLSQFAPEDQALAKKCLTKTLKQFLTESIFHHLLEYVLTDISGLNEIAQNHLRKTDITAFQQHFLERFKVRNRHYYQKQLEVLLDLSGAVEISALLTLLSEWLAERIHEIKRGEETEIFLRALDNWYLDSGLLTLIESNENFSVRFEHYVSRFLAISILSGMAEDETPIKSSAPFSGFQVEKYRIYQEDGRLSVKAKQRPHSAIEALNHNAQESRYIPHYLAMTEDQALNYFRLGFTGMCLMDRPAGYSDEYLGTVVVTIERSSNRSNSPEFLTQGLGRLRGEDFSSNPSFIVSLGKNQPLFFNLEKNLLQKDYFPALFKAEKAFNLNRLNDLGKEMGKELIRCFNLYPEEAEQIIDKEGLINQSFSILLSALRELNNQNNHQIDISCSQLSYVIASAMKKIEAEINFSSHPYPLNNSVRTIGFFLNGVSEIYYRCADFKPAVQRLGYSVFNLSRSHNLASERIASQEKLYLKSIKNHHFRGLIQKINQLNTFKDWIYREMQMMEKLIIKNTEHYLKVEHEKKLTTYKKNVWFSFLLKIIVPEKKEQVAKILNKIPNSLFVFDKILSSFRNICLELNPNITQELANIGFFQESICQVLQAIPGLEILTSEDILAIPDEITTFLKNLQQYPNLLQNKFFKDSLIQIGADYLNGPFLTSIKPLFLIPDYQQLQALLANKKKRVAFLESVLEKEENISQLFTPNFSALLMKEFRSFFKLGNKFDLFPNRLKTSISLIEKHFQKVKQNIFEHMEDSVLSRIASVLHRQIIPVLINYIEYDKRYYVFNSISLRSIEAVLRDHGSELISRLKNTQTLQEKARYFLPYLIFPMPNTLDPEKTLLESKQHLEECIKSLLSKHTALLTLEQVFTTAWLKPFQGTKSAYVKTFQVFLESDDFINNVALLMPYTGWIRLRKALNNPKQSLRLSEVFTDFIIKKENLFPSPEELVALLNKAFEGGFMTSKVALQTGLQEIGNLLDDYQDNPVNILSDTALLPIKELIEDDIVPILTHIVENRKDNETSDKQQRPEGLIRAYVGNLSIRKIIETLFEHVTYLSHLENKENIYNTNSPLMAVLFNSLLPKGMVNHALKEIDRLKESIIQSNDIQTGFCTELFRQFLTDPHLFKQLNIIENVTLTSLENPLKETLPLLMNLKDSYFFINSLKKLGMQALDEKKLSHLAYLKLAPIMFHNLFSSLLKDLIGCYSQEDLMVFCQVLGKENPHTEASSLFQFLNIIKHKDKKLFEENSLTFSPYCKLENLPLLKILRLVTDITEEVLNCHCYYNHHTNKGIRSEVPLPRLLAHASENLKSIRLPISNIFLSRMTPRIFFMKGVENSLAICGNIRAQADHNKIKGLKYINQKILHPLYLRISPSKLSRFLSKCLMHIVSSVTRLKAYILAGIKRIVYMFIQNTGNIPVDSMPVELVREENLRGEEEHVIYLAEKINQIEPLDETQALDLNCPPDSISSLEKELNFSQKPFFQSGQSFFISKLEEHADIIPQPEVHPLNA